MVPAPRLICLGDSITYGYPYGPRASWVHLAQVPGVRLVNRGLNGDTTAGMLRRLEAEVIAPGSAGAVVLGGTNDAFMGCPAAQYRSNVGEMVSRLKAAGIEPILGTVTPVHLGVASQGFPGQGLQIKRAVQLLEEYRRWLRSWAQDQEVPLMDFAAVFCFQKELPAGHLLIDGVHPSREGYRLMAAEARRVLTDLFPI